MKLNQVNVSSGTVITHFLDKSYWKINFKSHLNSILLQIRKTIVRVAHVLCDFFSLYLIVFTITMRLKSSNYKSHWNILVLFDYVPQKKSDFVSIPLFGFKLRDFDFESHWDILIIFDKERYGWCQTWICPMVKCLILFHVHCLGSL